MKKILFYSFIVTLILSGARVSHAQNGTYTLLEPLPCVPTTSNPCTPGTAIKQFPINQYIEYVFKFAIALAVLLATIMIIVGGFQYMTSDIPMMKSNAKQKFTDAGLGLAGALLSFLILQTIDPRLVTVNTQIPPICPTGSGTITTATTSTGGQVSICQPNTLTSFTSQLSTDLQNLSVQNRNAVVATQAQIDSLTQKKNTLISNYLESTPGDPNYMTKDQYDTQLATINQQISALTSQNTQQIVTGSIQQYFKGAFDQLHSADRYDSNTGAVKDTTLSSLASDEKASIDATFNKYLNDPSLDAASKQTLLNEDAFYKNQIDVEQALYVQLEAFPHILQTAPVSNAYSSATYYGPNSAYTNMRASLQASLKDYTNQLNALGSQSPLPDPSMQYIATDPILKTQYTTLLNDRINNINQALNANAPKP